MLLFKARPRTCCAAAATRVSHAERSGHLEVIYNDRSTITMYGQEDVNRVTT